MKTKKKVLKFCFVSEMVKKSICAICFVLFYFNTNYLRMYNIYTVNILEKYIYLVKQDLEVKIFLNVVLLKKYYLNLIYRTFDFLLALPFLDIRFYFVNISYCLFVSVNCYCCINCISLHPENIIL